MEAVDTGQSMLATGSVSGAAWGATVCGQMPELTITTTPAVITQVRGTVSSSLSLHFYSQCESLLAMHAS